ncbi:unnamed protein product, partial [Ascophyllum nodosum]
QHCAVDASAAVTREVKAVLGRLEATLIELSSLGRKGGSTLSPDAVFHNTKTSRAPTTAGTNAMKNPRAAGGVAGAAAVPAWNQLLDRVETLSRQLQWAERAAQRAVEGRIHVTRDSSAYLKPHGRDQRRPRDLRIRALDPDHFTFPPPTHGAAHQQPPGTVPPEGYASVVSPPASPPLRSSGSGSGGFGGSGRGGRNRVGSSPAAAELRAAGDANP